MIFGRSLSILALGALVMVSGCGSSNEEYGGQLGAVSSQALAGLKTLGQKTVKLPVKQVTPAMLATVNEAAMQVNPLQYGGSDFMRRIAVRHDDAPGTVAVWLSSDKAQLILRDGVLVGTRGLGYDIVSSDAAGTIQAVNNARTGGGERRYFVTGTGFVETEVSMRCDIENLGRQDVQVVNRTYTTAHMRESCIGGAGDRVRITNDYWVQPNSGTVRKSRQWVGPALGYFEFILLKE